MQLRDYQAESVRKIEAAYLRGLRRLLLVLPTGGGKTIVFSSLIRQWLAQGKRALVLAHRDRLIQQAVDKISKQIRGEQIGIVKAEQNRVHAPCVVASVQTLARAKRLSMLPQFDLVIIDECHRSRAKNYMQIVKHVLHTDSLLLGVTATPDRTDGLGLVPQVYEEVVHEVPIYDLIERGYLADIRVKNVGLPIDLSDVKTKRGTDGITDLDLDQLAVRMDAGNWYEKVTDAWLEHASDRRTIVFVPRVAMGYRLAEHLRERGVRAVALDGSTPLPAQRALIAEFERGTVQVLVNCDLLVEGVDVPSIDCVVLARPTKSRIVKMQSIGRGTRPSPETGKTDLLVLDLVAAIQPGICSAGDALGTKTLRENETVTEAKKRERQEAEEEAAREAEQLALIQEQLQTREVDLFGRTGKAEYEFKWNIDKSARRATLRVGKNTWVIEKYQDDVYMAYLASNGGYTDFPNYPSAKQWCEDEARKILFAPTAKWRNNPASEKQLAMLQRMRIPHAPGITRGAAADLITARFQQRRQQIQAKFQQQSTA